MLRRKSKSFGKFECSGMTIEIYITRVLSYDSVITNTVCIYEKICESVFFEIERDIFYLFIFFIMFTHEKKKARRRMGFS